MITIQQNILDVQKGFICQQVNCQHVMGAGLAKQIKLKWPIVWETYKNTPATLGMQTSIRVGGSLWVANLYGQDSYGATVRHTNYGAVAHALYSLFRDVQSRKLFEDPEPIHFPYAMGCGLGGGEWPIILELIEFYFPDAIICQLP